MDLVVTGLHFLSLQLDELCLVFTLNFVCEIFEIMPCCAAVNCSNRHEEGFRLFRFPNNKTRRDLWIAKLKRDNWKPTSCSALCEVNSINYSWPSQLTS